jgi:hypothetical protein
LGFEARIGVGWVVPFVVLNVDEYAVFFCCFEEELVVCEGFDSRFGYEDVDLPFDGVECYRVVRSVRGEDRDGVAGGEGVDSGFVGGGVADIVRRVGVEGGIQVVVGLRDVFEEVFAWRRSVTGIGGEGEDERMAGYLFPDVPTMLNFPTLPRRRRSNMVNPTTPTFLSDPDAPPPTKPVVYSPVPT